MTASRHLTDRDTKSLVLLVEPRGARNHRHAESLARAGYRVSSVAAEDIDIADVLQQGPAVVAAELDHLGLVGTLDLAKRLRENSQARLIPLIIYGHQLRPRDMENAARAGALWLQLEPADGARLVAAVRGLIAASRKETGDPAD
jgi:DNA-binding response OmpR family regulator